MEYISKCCSLPARKPRTGAVSVGTDPEKGKPKKETKGLGHWRCSGCGKSTKVTPQKPKPAEPAAPYPTPAVAEVLAQPEVQATIAEEAKSDQPVS